MENFNFLLLCLAAFLITWFSFKDRIDKPPKRKKNYAKLYRSGDKWGELNN